MLWARALIDPGKDLRRVPDRSTGCHEHRDRDPTAHAPGNNLMDALDVALLAIGHLYPLKRPPRLLAVVTDRDRDEPQHRRSLLRGLDRCCKPSQVRSTASRREKCGDSARPDWSPQALVESVSLVHEGITLLG
jgi:hypothetical protein